MRFLIAILLICLTSCGLQKPLCEYSVTASASEVRALYSKGKIIPLDYPYQGDFTPLIEDICLGEKGAASLYIRNDSFTLTIWSERPIDSIILSQFIFQYSQPFEKTCN